MKRRQFLAASASAAFGAPAIARAAAAPRVVIIGGGYGGATAAKYLRLWSGHKIAVTLVEPSSHFISCPLSNLVLGGSRQLSALTLSYDALMREHGVVLARDRARDIDTEKRQVRLEGGEVLPYDRLVLSPGVDFMLEQLPGMNRPGAADKVLHAWKAGPQTLALRRQLESMPDGGVCVISIPPAPYRCPPGPYERACQIAHYFKSAKPKAKLILLDANEDVTSKGALFKKVWAERYAGIIEYRPNFRVVDVDAEAGVALSELGEKVRADVLNVIPPQRAGGIALRAGLANAGKRWCGVDFQSFESHQVKQVHVIGDAIQVAPLMPKSAHMANQHAKIAAAALIDSFAGRAPAPQPMLTNTCYSYISDNEVIHVASVHRYDAGRKTLLPVPGSGGVSAAPTELEGRYAMNWAQNIWADSFM